MSTNPFNKLRFISNRLLLKTEDAEASLSLRIINPTKKGLKETSE